MLEEEKEKTPFNILRPNHGFEQIALRLNTIYGYPVKIPLECIDKSLHSITYDIVPFIMEIQKRVPYVVDQENRIANAEEMLGWLKEEPKYAENTERGSKKPRYLLVANDNHRYPVDEEGSISGHANIRIIYYVCVKIGSNNTFLLITKELERSYGWAIENSDVAKAYLYECRPMRFSNGRYK